MWPFFLVLFTTRYDCRLLPQCPFLVLLLLSFCAVAYRGRLEQKKRQVESGGEHRRIKDFEIYEIFDSSEISDCKNDTRMDHKAFLWAPVPIYYPWRPAAPLLKGGSYIFFRSIPCRLLFLCHSIFFCCISRVFSLCCRYWPWLQLALARGCRSSSERVV